MTPLELKSWLERWSGGAELNTPLELRRDVGDRHGVDLFLKREDRIDDVGSGHKLRKLHYFRKAILSQGANVIVTAGSLPSGQCVAVAAAAARWGLRSRLVYLGDQQVRPREATGHYLYASMLASRIEWFERTPWSEVDELLRRIAHEEHCVGAVPAIIAPGILEWPATLGSVDLGVQLYQQLEGYSRPRGRTHIVALAGTGGMCAGLWATSKLLHAEWTVHGICMGSRAAHKRRQLSEIARRYEGEFGIELGDVADLRLHEFNWSGIYAMPTAFELEGMRRILRDYQLPLDPNYMIKVFLGFEALLKAGEIRVADRVILIYSGGSIDFISGTPSAREWFSNQLADTR